LPIQKDESGLRPHQTWGSPQRWGSWAARPVALPSGCRRRRWDHPGAPFAAALAAIAGGRKL